MNTHRAVVANNIRWLLELREDVLGKDLAKFHTHLVCRWDISSIVQVPDTVYRASPKELMPQMTPCVKILCS